MNGRGSRGVSALGSAVHDPLLIAAVTLGAFVRVLPAIGTDFPIGDGGLIASMIDQVAANGLAPPERLEYNAANIPFAYPPAAIYLAAVPAIVGVPTLDLLRVLPVVLAILVIPAWYFLARDLFGVRTAGIAVMLYALTPKSYEWLIAGGGLTRGLGLVLAILGLTASLAYFRRPTLGWLLAAGILLGFCALSHPEAGVFGLATIGLLGWVRRASWKSVAAVVLVAVAVTLPWLVRIALLYGTTPFLSAGGSRVETYSAVMIELASLRFTHEPIVGIVAVLGAVGAFVALTSGSGWVLAWMIASVLIVPAAALTLIMLPWSVLGSMALESLARPRLSPSARRLLAPVGCAFLVIGCAWSPLLPYSPIWTLPRDIREASSRVAEILPPKAEVAVITGSYWPVDVVAEWFPYLTGLRSISTVQGLEFTHLWTNAVTLQATLSSCADEAATCIFDALSRDLIRIDLIVVPKGRLPGQPEDDCCSALRTSLGASAAVAFDSPGATAFRLRMP